MDREREGELFTVASAVLWGLFPILTILSFASLDPLRSLGWSTLFAGGFFAFLLTIRKGWNQLRRTQAWADILATTLWSTIYYFLVFWALQTTSAGNESIIALSEVFFSFLFFNIWRKEHISITHILGAVCTVVGAIIVLSPNVQVFNRGDMFVLLASAIAPFINFFQKRARKNVSSEAILFVRNTITGVTALALGVIIGRQVFGPEVQSALLVLGINGVIIFGLTKLFWLESIHRISVTKANALSCIAPFVTLLASWLLLGSAPTVWQLSAIVPMCLGVVLLGFRSPLPPPDISTAV